MSAATRIAIIGECMVELRHSATGMVQGFGGDTLNTAVYLSRMAGDQLRIDYVTGLGMDGFSDAMLSQWQSENVGTALVRRFASRLPGLYVIETEPNGERHFHYWRSEAAAKFWPEGEEGAAILQALREVDVIYLSGISLAILADDNRARVLEMLAEFRQSGGQVVFDNNYRPRLWGSVAKAQQAYRQMLALTDMAFLTFDDEVLLWGDTTPEQSIARSRELGVQEIIVKRGAEPCLLVTKAEQQEVAACTIDPALIRDTTAAGDSFSAGYLAARLCGADIATSAQQAHLLASTVIQHPGALIDKSVMPSAVAAAANTL